jgi:hypothetical protein
MSARGFNVRCLLFRAGLLSGAVSAGLSAPAAGAISAATASSTMTSDAADYIGQGLTYSYSTDTDDAFSSSTDGNAVHVTLTASNGDFWSLDFAAPAGQTLAPGTYSDANRDPFQGTGPGLDVSGNGRGCNTLTGSFTVSNLTFGPHSYLQSFDVSFEQQCEGADPALRGRLHVVNPPAPDPLQIALTLNQRDTAHRVTGTATVSVTVTCNRVTTVSLTGQLTQRANRNAISTGSFFIDVACSPTTTGWQVSVSSGNGVPFNPGSAHLAVTATAFDEPYDQQLTATQSATVRLAR